MPTLPPKPKMFLDDPKQSSQLTPRPELNLEETDKPSQVLAWAETTGMFVFLAIHNK